MLERVSISDEVSKDDPYFDPSWYWTSLGFAHMVLRRYADALAAFEHSTARPY
jgi:hypothetical protein